MDPALLAGVAAALAATLGLAALVRRRRATGERRRLASDLEGRLADALAPGTGSHLERAPTLRRIAVVDRRNGEPRYAPVVRIDLGTVEAPGTDLLFEYVAETVAAIHPVLEGRGVRVARYDVEFAFGPAGLLVEGECRRVSVPPDLADAVLAEEGYRASDLRRDVERAAGGEGPAALWAECTDE